ncbi:hypothetical protein ABIC76_003536 [Ralstonia sp. 1138]
MFLRGLHRGRRGSPEEATAQVPIEVKRRLTSSMEAELHERTDIQYTREDGDPQN